MTYDDYQQIRGQYADIDELCRGAEATQLDEASEDKLQDLVQLFHKQQREPEQIRSFLRHLGASGEMIGRLMTGSDQASLAKT
jgi:hypothetical protein